MNYTNKGRKTGTKRESRKTHYGKTVALPPYSAPALPKPDPTKVTTTTKWANYSAPKFAPVSDEKTTYSNSPKFRTPWSKDEYTGLRGSKIPAYVLDIDGTLQDFGSSASTKVLDWCKAIYKADPKAVFLVITARDHGSFGYESSFNWLMHAFPYPFIGPFARATDDPRYASEFKRELAQGFEDMGLYQIKGAADDNEYVIKMWKQWATDHFDDPKDFSLLECGYASYGSWRKDLPSKGAPSTSYTSGYNPHPNEHWDLAAQKYVSDFRPGQVWEHGAWDNVAKRYVQGYWKDVTVIGGKNRAAGTSHYDAEAQDLTANPAWKKYFESREAQGAYVGEPPPDVDGELQDILDQIAEDQGEGHSLYRQDLVDMVRHDFPGYSDEELADMSIEDLRENAGITGTWSEQDRVTYGDHTLFDDEHLYLDGDVHDDGLKMTRAQRIAYRLDLEDELYSVDSDITKIELENLDLLDLEHRVDRANAQRRANDEALDDENAPDGGPETAPLDVGEILRDLDTCAECGLEPNVHKLSCTRNPVHVAGNAAQGVA